MLDGATGRMEGRVRKYPTGFFSKVFRDKKKGFFLFSAII